MAFAGALLDGIWSVAQVGGVLYLRGIDLLSLIMAVGAVSLLALVRALLMSPPA